MKGKKIKLSKMKFNIGIYLFACIICFASCDFKRKTDDKNNTVIVEETFHISPSKITLFMEKDILRICPLTAAEFANEMKRQSEFMRCASYDNTAYKAFIELETLLKVAKGNSSQYSPNTSEYAQDTIELMVGGKPISLVAKSDILNRDNMPVNCVILYDYDAEITMDTISLLTTSSNGIIRLNSHLVQVDSITFCQARNIIGEVKRSL